MKKIYTNYFYLFFFQQIAAYPSPSYTNQIRRMMASQITCKIITILDWFFNFIKVFRIVIRDQILKLIKLEKMSME